MGSRPIGLTRVRNPDGTEIELDCEAHGLDDFFPSPWNTLYYLHTDKHKKYLSPDWHFADTLKAKFMREKPSYLVYDATRPPAPIPGQGHCLSYWEFMRLFSGTEFLNRLDGTRVGVSDLFNRPRYLLICCVFAPVMADANADSYRALSSLHHKIDNFDLVVVLKMRNGWENSQHAFSHFLSAFPSTCLTVPFDCPDTRDVVCSSLGLGSFDGTCSALLLNSDRCVLKKGPSILQHDLMMGSYSSFPFIEERLQYLREEEDSKISSWLAWDSGYTLPDICYLLHHVLLGIPSPDAGWFTFLTLFDGSGRFTDLTDITKKRCVGLYLCYDGKFLDKLCEVYQQTLSLGLDFEVVIVQLAFFSDTGSFLEDIRHALRQRSILTWWELPYDELISRRLWQLLCFATTDQLIILDSGSRTTVDLQGRGVMLEFGGVKSYPFTRDANRVRRYLILKSMNLVALLESASAYVRSNGPVPQLLTAPELLDKYNNIIIYLGYIKPHNDLLDKLLSKCYDNIRKAGAEVVFVPLDHAAAAADCNFSEERIAMMRWHIHPIATADFVTRELLRFDHYGETLVVFGKDGSLLSRQGFEHLTDEGQFSELLFTDRLWQEVTEDIWETFRADYGS